VVFRNGTESNKERLLDSNKVVIKRDKILVLKIGKIAAIAKTFLENNQY